MLVNPSFAAELQSGSPARCDFDFFKQPEHKQKQTSEFDWQSIKETTSKRISLYDNKRKKQQEPCVGGSAAVAAHDDRGNGTDGDVG